MKTQDIVIIIIIIIIIILYLKDKKEFMNESEPNPSNNDSSNNKVPPNNQPPSSDMGPFPFVSSMTSSCLSFLFPIIIIYIATRSKKDKVVYYPPQSPYPPPYPRQ
jgi:hypothetical protein